LPTRRSSDLTCQAPAQGGRLTRPRTSPTPLEHQRRTTRFFFGNLTTFTDAAGRRGRSGRRAPRGRARETEGSRRLTRLTTRCRPRGAADRPREARLPLRPRRPAATERTTSRPPTT